MAHQFLPSLSTSSSSPPRHAHACKAGHRAPAYRVAAAAGHRRRAWRLGEAAPPSPRRAEQPGTVPSVQATSGDAASSKLPSLTRSAFLPLPPRQSASTHPHLFPVAVAGTGTTWLSGFSSWFTLNHATNHSCKYSSVIQQSTRFKIAAHFSL